jgi:2-keto-3-deoxy-galactonokinase
VLSKSEIFVIFPNTHAHFLKALHAVTNSIQVGVNFVHKGTFKLLIRNMALSNASKESAAADP